jgi:hypothetical protein
MDSHDVSVIWIDGSDTTVYTPTPMEHRQMPTALGSCADVGDVNYLEILTEVSV